MGEKTPLPKTLVLQGKVALVALVAFYLGLYLPCQIQ
jgi:hypothetical protein